MGRDNPRAAFRKRGVYRRVNYDREVTLRDSKGNVILNDDSGARMRPDYIVHFPDGNDVVIDSKVSLAAFSDYIRASDEAARKEASARNLASVKEQVRRLSGKNYSAYLAPGHRMLDYTVMFIPNYSALSACLHRGRECLAGCVCQKRADNHRRDADAVPADDYHRLEEYGAGTQPGENHRRGFPDDRARG